MRFIARPSRRTVVTVLLSVGGIVAFLFVFDVGAMSRELQGIDPLPVMAGLAAVLLAIACWAESMRRVLIAAGGGVPAHRGFLAYANGMFAKQILPMGNAGGIPIMAYAIDREADVGFNRSLAVVTVADFMGLLSSLLLTVVGVAYVVVLFPDTRLLQAALVGVGVSAAVLVSVAVLLLYRRSVLRFAILGIARLLRGTIGRVSKRVEGRLAPGPITAGVDRYFETVDTVANDRRSLLTAASLAMLGWTLFVVPLYTAAMALRRPIRFGLVLFVVAVGGVATLVPLPGGLGGIEFAVAGMVVATTGIELAIAGTMVVVYRLCVYWFPIAVGLAAVVYGGTSVRSMNADASELLEEPGKS